MKVRPIKQYEQNEVQIEGATGTKMRMLIGPDDGAGSFHMRQFEVAPGGHTPHHDHNYEHEVFVLSGNGVARSEQGDRPFQEGDVIFVPPGEKHQFVNTGREPLSFICLIPAPGGCQA